MGKGEFAIVYVDHVSAPREPIRQKASRKAEIFAARGSFMMNIPFAPAPISGSAAEKSCFAGLLKSSDKKDGMNYLSD